MSRPPRSSSPATSLSGCSAGTSSRNRVTAVSIRLLVSDGEDRARRVYLRLTLRLRLGGGEWGAAVVAGDDGGAVLGQERVHHRLARGRPGGEPEGGAEGEDGQQRDQSAAEDDHWGRGQYGHRVCSLPSFPSFNRTAFVRSCGAGPACGRLPCAGSPTCPRRSAAAARRGR